MEQENKELLLKDLSARLLYEPWVWFQENWNTNPNFKGNVSLLRTYHLDYIIEDKDITLMPYLRPMSSMTEEEREHLQTLHNIISDENYGDGFSPAAWEAISEFNVYCYERHLDNRGLIEIGLALEAPEHMYD